MEVDTSSVEPKGKNKRRQSRKKSAENRKRKQILETLLKCDTLPKYISTVLKQEDQGNNYFLKLNSNEIERFWKELSEFTTKQVAELLTESGDKQEVSNVVSAIIKLVHLTMMFHSTERNLDFIEMVVLLNSAMGQLDSSHKELQNEICQLSEWCCINNLWNLPGEFYLDTVVFLLNLTLDETCNNKMPMVKRMWAMCEPLSRMNLHATSCEQIVNKLNRVVVSSSYYSFKEGRGFISFTLALDVKFLKKFYRTIKGFLVNCQLRSHAKLYGEIFFNAWVNGPNEIREALEFGCIQNLMEHMFKFPRIRGELCKLGKNVFTILSCLHQSRTNTLFSKTLTELYMPLLWRHLRSGNNIERCNAAEVFLDVYPLEKPGSGQVEVSAFLARQHSEMVDLLTDNCHFVRIIAIKGICLKLCSAWDTFPPDCVQVLMRNMIALASDGSTYLVRRTLYESLVYLLQNPDSAKYLCGILPQLRDFIHDENDKVRKAFVNMLIALQKMTNPPVKVWRIVNVSTLVARLEEDNEDVGSVICQLLMKVVYTPKMKLDRFLFRLMGLIKMSPKGSRKLFQYSRKALDWKQAVRLMLTILINLRRHVKEKEQEIEEQQRLKSSAEPTPFPNKRMRLQENFSSINEDIENIQDNQQTQSRQDEEVNQLSHEVSQKLHVGEANKDVKDADELFSNKEVIHALVDIVSLLWSLHGQQISDPAHEEDYTNLLDSAVACIPLCLKYYKGGQIYYAVIHLASLVPANKLMPVSTVGSACMSHLKQMTEDTPLPEIKCVIHALCSWNRFADIQDLVVDWIDQAFRCEGLNQSQAVVNDQHKRKVRFVAKEGKPMLALKILDILFSHPMNSQRVLKKSYNNVHELYVYLERIKVLVERRLLQGTSFESPMLSDEFLLKCLYRHTLMIIHLHRPLPPEADNNETTIVPFDANDVFQELFQWAIRVVNPMLPPDLEEEPDISVLFLKGILRAAANLIDLLYASEQTISRVAELIRQLMSTEWSLWFVESCLIVVKHIKDFSEYKYGFEEGGQLMNSIVPTLISYCLKALCHGDHSKEQIDTCVENLNEMRQATLEVLLAMQRLSDKSHLISILKLFTDCLVTIMSRKELQLLDLEERVQDLPFVCGLIISIVCRFPMNSLWLSTMPESIAQLYFEDSKMLMSFTSLLYTLAHSSLPLPKAKLSAALKAAYHHVTVFTGASTQASAEEERVESDFSSNYLDVKPAIPILTDLATFLNCPLR